MPRMAASRYLPVTYASDRQQMILQTTAAGTSVFIHLSQVYKFPVRCISFLVRCTVMMFCSSVSLNLSVGVYPFVECT